MNTAFAVELPTVIVAVCAPEVFAPTEKFTVPLPVPVAPELIETTDGGFGVAVQVQLGSFAVTLNVPVLAVVGKVPEAALSVKKQLCALCVIVNGVPPIMMLPVRGPPRFGATVNWAFALPTSRVDPDGKVIHGANDTRKYEHCDEVVLVAVTATEPEPPAGRKLADGEPNVKEHVAPGSC